MLTMIASGEIKGYQRLRTTIGGRTKIYKQTNRVSFRFFHKGEQKDIIGGSVLH